MGRPRRRVVRLRRPAGGLEAVVGSGAWAVSVPPGRLLRDVCRNGAKVSIRPRRRSDMLRWQGCDPEAARSEGAAAAAEEQRATALLPAAGELCSALRGGQMRPPTVAELVVRKPPGVPLGLVFDGFGTRRLSDVHQPSPAATCGAAQWLRRRLAAACCVDSGRLVLLGAGDDALNALYGDRIRTTCEVRLAFEPHSSGFGGPMPQQQQAPPTLRAPPPRRYAPPAPRVVPAVRPVVVPAWQGASRGTPAFQGYPGGPTSI